MTPEKTLEIALQIEEWRLMQFGSERYMGELKAVAEDMDLPEEEMLQFCLNVFVRRIKRHQQQEK